LVDVLVDSINKGDTTTMGKWAMRALVPIVGSNEQQLEQIITHNLFGKVNKLGFFPLIYSLVYRQKLPGGQPMVQHHLIVGYY
jgi:hypothetical protein